MVFSSSGPIKIQRLSHNFRYFTAELFKYAIIHHISVPLKINATENLPLDNLDSTIHRSYKTN